MSQLISIQMANEEIGRYLLSAEQAQPATAGITASAESKKYFTTPPQSFVFSKADIEQLWQLNPGANGLKVYNASKADGAPTVVLVACQTQPALKAFAATAGAVNLVASDVAAAIQFPGISVIQNTGNFDITTDNA